LVCGFCIFSLFGQFYSAPPDRGGGCNVGPSGVFVVFLGALGFVCGLSSPRAQYLGCFSASVTCVKRAPCTVWPFRGLFWFENSERAPLPQTKNPPASTFFLLTEDFGHDLFIFCVSAPLAPCRLEKQKTNLSPIWGIRPSLLGLLGWFWRGRLLSRRSKRVLPFPPFDGSGYAIGLTWRFSQPSMGLPLGPGPNGPRRGMRLSAPTCGNRGPAFQFSGRAVFF